jgi:hypothetical protein
MPEEKWRPVVRRFPPPYDDVYGPGDDVGSWRVAARWWEPQRLHYNAVLLAVFIALMMRTWSRIAPELTPGNLLRLVVLGLIANLCYSAAYPADMALQTVRPPSARNGWRWVIWTAGTLFAVLLETYWYLDEILPPPVP